MGVYQMKTLPLIPHNKPALGKEEITAATHVLKSNWIVAGKEVGILEENIRKYIGLSYAVGVNSGTAALHLSLLSLGVSKGDEVILPTYTCNALLNAIYYVNATPIIVDSEKNSCNIDPQQIAEKITKKTKAIIIPHTFGLPAKIDEIKKLKIPVVEDCAIGIGSFYKGKPLGSFGDISIFSLYATKMIAAGYGGMFVTNRKDYYLFARDIIDYNGRDTYAVRYSYQLSDISAAIANKQFNKLNSFIKRRKKIATMYRSTLDKKGVSYWPEKEDTDVNHYRFIIRFTDMKLRDKVQEQLKKKMIQTIIPIPNYELLHNLLKINKSSFPVAEDLTQITLSLPVYPSLSDSEVMRITTELQRL
jgi:perosamine synthetase